MRLHISDLKNWSRCPLAVKHQMDDATHIQTSRLAFGTVMHHCLHVLERYGDLQKAIDTFIYYWNPHNISELCEPVHPGGWIARDSYGQMRDRGVTALRAYASVLPYDDAEVLALEYEFVVPILGTPHELGGTVDRLTARRIKRVLHVGIDDWKTGIEPANLRQDLQGTGYAYASTRPEFWLGFPGQTDGFGPERGQELMDRFAGKGRQFTWINLQTFKFVPGGERVQQDYNRLAMAVTEVARSIEAGIFPPNISGATCTYCPFQRSCGGIGLAGVVEQ